MNQELKRVQSNVYPKLPTFTSTFTFYFNQPQLQQPLHQNDHSAYEPSSCLTKIPSLFILKILILMILMIVRQIISFPHPYEPSLVMRMMWAKPPPPPTALLLRCDSILALQTLQRELQVPSLHHVEVRLVAGPPPPVLEPYELLLRKDTCDC